MLLAEHQAAAAAASDIERQQQQQREETDTAAAGGAEGSQTHRWIRRQQQKMIVTMGLHSLAVTTPRSVCASTPLHVDSQTLAGKTSATAAKEEEEGTAAITVRARRRRVGYREGLKRMLLDVVSLLMAATLLLAPVAVHCEYMKLRRDSRSAIFLMHMQQVSTISAGIILPVTSSLLLPMALLLSFP